MSLERRECDVVVIGSGSGGSPLAQELAAGGLSVTIVEAGRVGGACAYVACVPSKALLRAARRARRPRRREDEINARGWAHAVLRRDEAAHGRDDGAARAALRDSGVTLVCGRGRLNGQALVEVVDPEGERRRLHARRAVVLATGSRPLLPPVDGLSEVDYWTSEDALSRDELPEHLLLLGGGPVACELAEIYVSFGAAVSMVERDPRLLGTEQAWVGERMRAHLESLGVAVHTGTTTTRLLAAPGPVGGDGAGVLAELDDGGHLAASRLLLATGRRPNSDGIGLETVGAEAADDGSLPVDARCRLLDGAGLGLGVPCYALGDVTGRAPYTHTANYQARIVAADLLGRGRDADYAGVPRAVYTEQTVYAVGLTERQAHDEGVPVVTGRFDLADLSRGTIEDAQGAVEILVRTPDHVVVGGVAVGPGADGWGGELRSAVRWGVTVEQLTDNLAAYPTYAEGIQLAARQALSALSPS